jgi:hypothetical protein
MIVDVSLGLLRQLILLAAFIGLPIWWLILAGRTDVLDSFLSGEPHVAALKVITTPVHDFIHASSISLIMGGVLYHNLGWSFSLIRIPIIGSLDMVLAKSAILLGLSSLIIAYRLGVYN